MSFPRSISGSRVDLPAAARLRYLPEINPDSIRERPPGGRSRRNPQSRNALPVAILGRPRTGWSRTAADSYTPPFTPRCRASRTPWPAGPSRRGHGGPPRPGRPAPSRTAAAMPATSPGVERQARHAVHHQLRQAAGRRGHQRRARRRPPPAPRCRTARSGDGSTTTSAAARHATSARSGRWPTKSTDRRTRSFRACSTSAAACTPLPGHDQPRPAEAPAASAGARRAGPARPSPTPAVRSRRPAGPRPARARARAAPHGRRRDAPAPRLDPVVDHRDVVRLDLEQVRHLGPHRRRAGDQRVGAVRQPPLHRVHLLVQRLRQPPAVPARLGRVDASPPAARRRARPARSPGA